MKKHSDAKIRGKNIKQDGEIKDVQMAEAGQVFLIGMDVSRDGISRDKGQDEGRVKVRTDPGVGSGGWNR